VSEGRGGRRHPAGAGIGDDGAVPGRHVDVGIGLLPPDQPRIGDGASQPAARGPVLRYPGGVPAVAEQPVEEVSGVVRQGCADPRRRRGCGYSPARQNRPAPPGLNDHAPSADSPNSQQSNTRLCQ
jgi:hypothetical protein